MVSEIVSVLDAGWIDMFFPLQGSNLCVLYSKKT